MEQPQAGLKASVGLAFGSVHLLFGGKVFIFFIDNLKGRTKPKNGIEKVSNQVAIIRMKTNHVL